MQKMSDDDDDEYANYDEHRWIWSSTSPWPSTMSRIRRFRRVACKSHCSWCNKIAPNHKCQWQLIPMRNKQRKRHLAEQFNTRTLPHKTHHAIRGYTIKCSRPNRPPKCRSSRAQRWAHYCSCSTLATGSRSTGFEMLRRITFSRLTTLLTVTFRQQINIKIRQ